MTTTYPQTAPKEPLTPLDIDLGKPTCGRFVLENDGTISSCDAGCETLFAASEHALVGKHISVLVPKLATSPRAEHWLNPNIVFLSHCEMPFRTKRLDGTPFISALYFYRIIQGGLPRIAVLVRELSPPTRPENATWLFRQSEWCLE